MSALVSGVLSGLVLSVWTYLAGASRRRMRRYWERSCTDPIWLAGRPLNFTLRTSPFCQVASLISGSSNCSR